MVKQYIFGSVFAALVWALITTTTYAANYQGDVLAGDKVTKRDLTFALNVQNEIIKQANLCIKLYRLAPDQEGFIGGACQTAIKLWNDHSSNLINLEKNVLRDVQDQNSSVLNDPELLKLVKDWHKYYLLMLDYLREVKTLQGTRLNK